MPDMATKKPLRDVNITFRCSEDERQTMHDAAALDGLPLSQWLRRIALKEARKARRDAE
jgi:uncharacterized protein (DUF1778 family)